VSHTNISREDISILQAVWSNLKIDGPSPLRSHYAAGLRLYPIDIIAEGLKAGSR
jgi:hypothetical protein